MVIQYKVKRRIDLQIEEPAVVLSIVSVSIKRGEALKHRGFH